MQKWESSGLMAVNLFFSGRKKVCLIRESPDYFMPAISASFSCIKTCKEPAQQVIRSIQSSFKLLRLSQARRPITCSSCMSQAGLANSSLLKPWLISATYKRCCHTSCRSFSNLVRLGTSANGSPISLINALKSNSQCWSSYSTLQITID